MKKKIYYECEICKQLYENEQSAIDCENQGIEQPLVCEGDIVTIIDKGEYRTVSIYLEDHLSMYELEKINEPWQPIEFIDGNRDFERKCRW